MPTTTAQPTNLFDHACRRFEASPSNLRAACRSLGLNYHRLDDDALDLLNAHYALNPTARMLATLDPSNHNSTKESHMSASTTAKPRRARKSADKPSVDKPVSRKRDDSHISAAEVARQHKLDGRKFRAFCRANNIDRSFATKGDASKAVKAFRKATSAD